MAAREKSRRSISRPLRLEGYLSGAKLGRKKYFVCSCGLVFSLHRFNDRQPKNDFHTIIRVLEEEIREGVLHLKVKWSGSTSNGSALYPDTWMPPIAKVYVSLFIVDVLNQLFQLRTPDEGMVSQFRIRRAALAQHRECGHVRLTSAYEGGLQFLCTVFQILSRFNYSRFEGRILLLPFQRAPSNLELKGKEPSLRLWAKI